ncbi:6-hydroxymethylpterin diphosphokinase MptE-like protein [Leptospira sp. GIMC2001]|uniref:6-hydroxymethylpterin diphosphokinase MptE-like protein n=1 Tax=Leptospira sp. GIMC2001 TaxID=1513297 RepID=UPI00234A195B|nr:6-hydroxymethylpterin diphosphokinase MptE-like protein [Leptospira sp. GIMC2001]WCL49940.1 DUF115 domain-containing protein [Leptospira sp. GIMC2001]
MRNLETEWRKFQSELVDFLPISKNTKSQTNPSSSINESTKLEFSNVWTSNYLKNLSKYTKIPILKPNSHAQNQALVFIGAAPNLEDQVNWLKENRENCFYISSDTALRYLFQVGIEPDAILTVDPSRGSFFHLMDAKDKIPIYTWLGSHRQAFEKNMNPSIFLTTHPLDQILGESLGLSDSMILRNPSLNLAGMAKALAMFWKMPAIILAGWSLKSSRYKTHCRGSGYESYYLPFTNRIKTLENLYPLRVYKKNLTSKNQIAIDNMLGSADLKVIDLSDFRKADQCIDELRNIRNHEIKFQPGVQLFSKPKIESWKLFISKPLVGVDSRKFRKFASFL